MSRIRRWCFTSFKVEIKDKKYDNNKFKYLIMGSETCPKTKKKHIQGYIEFTNPRTIGGVKKFFEEESMHLEPAKGTREHNITYCSKDNDFITVEGAKDTTNNKSLTESIDFVKSHINDGSWVILNQYPSKYIRFITLYPDIKKSMDEEKLWHMKEEWLKNFKPNKYQLMFEEHINKQNNRQITWIYDKKGGCGKSWYAKFKCYNGAVLFTNSRSNDIAYAYNGENIVIFDFSRNLEDKINYSVIEHLKNGMIFSSKYKSNLKMFDSPKIIIMANFKPDLTEMSQDRWDVVEIS